MSGRERACRGMGAESRSEPGGRRLNTWKEIAGFFGCDERTVKRWEASRRLPVRRLPNGSRSAVFAYEAELRAWLDGGGAADLTGRDNAPVDSDPSHPAFRLSRVALTVLFVAAVLAGLAALRLAFPTGRNEVSATP